MNTLNRDPKGYYIVLGIGETADTDAIKSAYRTKAKRLHPDFNPSPIAAKQFHRLHEAYETLCDPEKRAAYDRPWKSDSAKGSAPGGASAWRSKPKPEPEREKAKPRAEEPSRPRADSSTSASTHAATGSSVDQPAVCKCGKVTAQPRYVIFDLVWGRVTRVQRRGVSGVFCRSCADRTAIRASLTTWLAGWWAWPDGPRETVRALVSNIRGGRKPPDRNARLLMRQSRAFRARGEMELARNTAEQAIGFATTPSLRREVDQLLLSLSAHPARALIDRWAGRGWAPAVQALPLALAVGAVSFALTLAAPQSLVSSAKNMFADMTKPAPAAAVAAPTRPRAPSAPMGRVYTVVANTASLRTGPGASYQLVAVLKQRTLVLVTETDPTGQWLRVVTGDGAAGFALATQMSPDVRMDALKDVGGFGKPAPTEPADASH